MSFNTFVSDLAAGVLVAVVAGGIALVVAKRITGPLEKDRDEAARWAAATDDFYRAYGGFFAAWKEWAAFKPDGDSGQRALTNEQWVTLLARVADAEGALESFLIRLTLERTLEPDEITRLWCFRQGYKSLRYAVRDSRALGWRRTDAVGPAGLLQHGMFVSYHAFKWVALSVAAMLATRPAKGASAPTVEASSVAFEAVTSSRPPRGSAGSDAAAPAWAVPGSKEPSWRWVLVADGLRSRAATL